MTAVTAFYIWDLCIFVRDMKAGMVTWETFYQLNNIVIWMSNSITQNFQIFQTRMQSLCCQKQHNRIGLVFMTMVREEGIFRPIKGMSAMAAGAGPAHAMYFTAVEKTRDFLTARNVSEHLASGKFTQYNWMNYLIWSTFIRSLIPFVPLLPFVNEICKMKLKSCENLKWKYAFTPKSFEQEMSNSELSKHADKLYYKICYLKYYST